MYGPHGPHIVLRVLSFIGTPLCLLSTCVLSNRVKSNMYVSFCLDERAFSKV